MKNSENKEIVTVRDENWKKENLEWFKKALIEGVNNRIQREIDKCDDNSTPSEPIISKELWDEVQKYLPNVMKDMIENDTRYTRGELIEMLKNRKR